MIVESGPRRIAVVADEPSARYGADEGTGDLRRYVEVRVATGGLMPRAAVGGTLTPGPEPLQVEIRGSGDADTIAASTVSHLGKPLCPGLPDEFAAAVQTSLTAGLPGGTVTIDRAAYDPVDSSVRSFRLAAEILAAALCFDVEHGPGDDAQLRELLERLPAV